MRTTLRTSGAFALCLAVSLAPLAAKADNSSTTTTITYAAPANAAPVTKYVPTNNDQTVYTEQNTASMPSHPYASGREYIVNPIDMTNTRDNRGDIAQDGTGNGLRDYRTVNNGGWNQANDMNTTTTTRSTYQ